MKPAIAKILLPLTIPFGTLVLSYIFFLRLDTISASLLMVIQHSSYGVFFTGMILSCRFNRNRIFFITAILALSQLALIDFAPEGVSENVYASVVYQAICLLIPVNILIFSLLQERGILTSWGKIYIAFILIQIFFVALIISSGDKEFTTFINKGITSLKLFPSTPLSQFSILAFFITFLVLMVRQFLNQSSLEGSLVGVLFASAIALHLKDANMAIPIFFSAAGLMLIIAVIQDSYSMAYLDELTGLPGRRALREEMRKLGGRYCIAMLDIDFFKKFNDTYGHDVGDDVLKLVASIIKHVTGGGKSFRYGGEEFTILFPGKKIDEVLPHLDELRDKISKRGFTQRGKDRPKNKPKDKPQQAKSNKRPSKQLFITVSIGVAEKSERYKTADDVVKAADTALYRAKEAGRNRVSK